MLARRRRHNSPSVRCLPPTRSRLPLPNSPPIPDRSSQRLPSKYGESRAVTFCGWVCVWGVASWRREMNELNRQHGLMLAVFPTSTPTPDNPSRLWQETDVFSPFKQHPPLSPKSFSPLAWLQVLESKHTGINKLSAPRRELSRGWGWHITRRHLYSSIPFTATVAARFFLRT